MSLNGRGLKMLNESSLSEKVVSSFQTFVKNSKPKLWGICKKKKLIGYAVHLALHKDIKGLFYRALKPMLPRDKRWSVNTLHHNQLVLRHLMEEWSREVMSRVIVKKYRKRTGREGVKFFKKKPIFLIDSTDFKIKGFHHILKTNKL